MAVTTTSFASAGRYEPFHVVGRAGGDGRDPVGTLFIDANATGDATGGAVTINIAMGMNDFGFRMMFVPTFVSVQDALAAAEVMEFLYTSGGNKRITANVSQHILGIRGGPSDVDVHVVTQLAMLIEPFTVAAADIMSARWATNTDTKAYHMHVFGVCYDAEVIAKEGGIPDLVAGLR